MIAKVLVKDRRRTAMSDKYNRYQISVSAINLPERFPPERVMICTLTSQMDYKKVLSLFLQIFPNEVDLDKVLQLHELPRPLFEGAFIAKIEQEIIGFLISGQSNQIAYIMYLGVIEQYQSQGIATALLEQLKSYLKAKNIQIIRCSIRKDNVKTINYIKYLGFHLMP
jgi:ribosomal protein S18 acetylase RimI-like enzyme